MSKESWRLANHDLAEVIKVDDEKLQFLGRHISIRKPRQYERDNTSQDYRQGGVLPQSYPPFSAPQSSIWECQWAAMEQGTSRSGWLKKVNLLRL